MSDGDWKRKIKREHVVSFRPLGAKDQGNIPTKIVDGLAVLGYEVPGEHPIGFGWEVEPYWHLEIVYGSDRIGLDSWESAVLYALAHADAFGEVTAQTRTRVVPAVFT